MQFLKDKYTLKLVFFIFNLFPFLFFRLSPAMSTLLIITKEKSLTGEEEKFVMQRLYSSYNRKKNKLSQISNLMYLIFDSSANKCLVKVAQYAAQLEQYEKAISIYEEVRFYLSFLWEMFNR